MEKLKQRVQSCRQALDTLDEALQMPFSVIVRDGSIQRFEYSFESTWKLLKLYLAQYEGVICNSPKQCFRAALNVGLCSEDETKTALVMTDDRNLTSHTYIEDIAVSIHQRLPNYAALMRSFLRRAAQRMDLNNG